jgi:DNA repair photolyase
MNNIAGIEFPLIEVRAVMGGKRVFDVDLKTVMNFKSDFRHKALCDGYIFSLGSACAIACTFCYSPSIVRKHPKIRRLLASLASRGLTLQDIVIRRRNALDILLEELTSRLPASVDLNAEAVVFTSPLVDPAPNMELALETAEACGIIWELTGWTVRLLSKSSLVKDLAQRIPDKFRDRVIIGVSTGTLDDRLAESFEEGAPLVS